MSELAVTLLTILARYGPAAYTKAVEIANKKDPTPADYLELADIAKKSSEGYFETKVTK